jgi:glycosyltransferase involved in cell wall biosynthesis
MYLFTENGAIILLIAYDSPIISLIIRTWNESAHIQQALTTAIDQIIIPDEIIVIDSGSLDGSHGIKPG